MFILLSDTLKVVMRTNNGSRLYFNENDYIVVTESLEDIYERIASAEKRYRK